MSLPAVSKRLKVPAHAGLIARMWSARWRPCRIEGGPLRDAVEWMEPFRRFREESFDRLEGVLVRMRQKEKKRGRKPQS